MLSPFLELIGRLELPTSSLPRMCSTTWAISANRTTCECLNIIHKELPFCQHLIWIRRGFYANNFQRSAKQGRFKSIFPELGTKTKKYTFFKLTHIRILYKNNRKFQFHIYKKSSVSCANSQKCNNNIVTYTYCMSKYYKLPVKRILNLQELREKCIILSYYIEGFCALFIIFLV